MNANVAGFAAIGMWSLLALLTAASGNVPPFLLLAMTFSIGTLTGLVSWLFRRPDFSSLRLPVVVWLTGIAGLFGYHFFYYTALRSAPVAEASLIAFLWPLLIVLGSTLLPGEKFRWFHGAGALLGFCGAILLMSQRFTGESIQASHYWGYGAAFLCAFIWSGYSVLSRLFKRAPSDAVVFYCLATAVLSFICHLLLEETVLPQSRSEWLAVVGLGLMPVGIAFYAWDHAMKHGNIQLLGSAAYAAPVISTFILLIFGFAAFTWQLAVAAVLVTLGAVIASGKFLKEGG